jgi:transcriptional regulator with XRE-family HTH domain
MKYGSKIRTIRLIKNIQSKNMATALKMTTTNYSKVENDKINLSEENLEVVAKELGVSIDFIKIYPKTFLLRVITIIKKKMLNMKYIIHLTKLLKFCKLHCKLCRMKTFIYEKPMRN